jgi:hypothetical protein
MKAKTYPLCPLEPTSPLAVLARAVRNLALQDFLVLGFHLVMWVRSLLAPPGALTTSARLLATGLLILALTMVLLCRGELLPAGRLRALLYRLFALSCVFLSYFEMGLLLRALRPKLLDAPLLAIDRALFGETPAKVFEHWLTPSRAAWFSFFYYSYVWLMGFNLIGTAALDGRRRRRHELLLAGTLVGLCGHFTYALVPAVGPYAHMSFAGPIEGGFWWNLVRTLVDDAGAVLDVFPSLHTAFPSLFALHAIRHRRTPPFRWLWPVSVFFAANIVCSTMLLRWHYAIDVVAGLVLAFGAHRIAIAVAARVPLRERAGRQASFE